MCTLKWQLYGRNKNTKTIGNRCGESEAQKKAPFNHTWIESNSRLQYAKRQDDPAVQVKLKKKGKKKIGFDKNELLVLFHQEFENEKC